MFEEVGGAIGLVRFGAGAGVDPDADGAGLGVRGVFGGNLGRSVSIKMVIIERRAGGKHTVKPLLNVVLSVVAP